MPKITNTPEVLWSTVNKQDRDGCWPWGGWKSEQGYGRVEINGKSYYAHRVIYALANPGSIEWNAPKDKNSTGFIRHTCDNPSCCNPNHLLVGTHLENMRDKVNRGRGPDFSGGKSKRCKLTMEDVFFLRLQRKRGAKIKALQMLYELSEAAIKQCIYGKTYRDTA